MIIYGKYQVVYNMRVLVCGDRNWSDINCIKNRIQQLVDDTEPDLTIISGGCRGADSIAEQIANELGIQILIFPANWAKFGRAAGPIRNKQMIEEGKPDLVIAFHPDITLSKGTKDMINQAVKNDIPCEIISS